MCEQPKLWVSCLNELLDLLNKIISILGNEFIEDGVVFYCKRCDVRMQNKNQLEVHMSSNQHKMNHPIAPIRVADPFPTANQQLFNFESSSYGYGYRPWAMEQHMFNQPAPQMTQSERQHQAEMEQQQKLVEQAKSALLARFPYYAISMQNNQQQENPGALSFTDDIPLPSPLPVEAPSPSSYNMPPRFY